LIAGTDPEEIDFRLGSVEIQLAVGSEGYKTYFRQHNLAWRVFEKQHFNEP